MTIGNDSLTLAKNPVRHSKSRNIIAVASGKGGVGKTWLSITLAQALSRAGKKTLLFDGDLGLANVDIQLALVPKYDLANVVAGQVTLNQAITNYPGTGSGGSFDIIAGRSGSGTLSNIPLSRLRTLTDDIILLAKSYDHVVVDLGAGIDRSVRTMARIASTILVITTDEPTSLTDAYAFIKVNQMEAPGTDVGIVVNIANSVREGERIYNTLLKACEGFLKISPQLMGVVRRDLKVREAIRNQTPLLTRSPNSEAASDIENIARKLL